jgi:hypothetical protein
MGCQDVANLGTLTGCGAAMVIQLGSPQYHRVHDQCHRSATQAQSGGWCVMPTPEQITLLAACVIAGRSRTETAKMLGVSPRSVSRWNTDPRVLVEVERARDATIETRMIGVLEALAHHAEDERTRLHAAQSIVRWAIQLRSI